MLDKIYFGNYADKNTPYSSNEGIDQVIRTMEEFSIPLLNDLRIAKKYKSLQISFTTVW